MTLLLIVLRSTLILALFLGLLPLIQKRTSLKFQRLFLLVGLMNGILPWLAYFMPHNQLYVAALTPILVRGNAIANQLQSSFAASAYLWPVYWAGVVQSAHPLLDEAALSALQKMKNWTPGEIQGKKARYKWLYQ